ncbi:MAG TPA: DUF302 domain-containing protein [Ignavibacteria bacterium]|nr:DUF302 domain-containing protein [Ignavibacteria bacterium]
MEYGLSKETNYSFEDAVEKTTASLKEAGFGILTTIDMKETLKNKIDVDIDKYTILGACNPAFAYKGVQMEQEIGLLLPCNVIVYEKDGKTRVSIMNPEIMTSVTGNDELSEFGIEVKKILSEALNRI